MTLGAAEDVVRAPDLVRPAAKMAQLRLAGFTAVRVTSNWLPGPRGADDNELTVLRNVEAAARLVGREGLRLRLPPRLADDAARARRRRREFAQYTAALARAIPSFDDVIVGNEPNLNRFWLPQFGLDGANASAPAYLQLLARTYDALKAVDPKLRVWGGALAPRGGDRPEGTRPTSSPTAFIQAMGAAYRASGRTTPVMDGLAIHPYPDNSSHEPRTSAHPRIDDDRPRRLRQARRPARRRPSTARRSPARRCRSSTTSSGSSRSCPTGKRSLYSGNEPTTTKPVDETKQAAAYDLGLRLAFCQPNVAGILLFHSHDETALLSWQSGVYYADGTPKASLPAVRDALDRTRGGSITRCEGLALDIALENVRFPGQAEFLAGKRDMRFRCTLDCAWEVVATRTTTARPPLRVRGYGRWGTPDRRVAPEPQASARRPSGSRSR